jgi:excisionase family DNA binding protein
MQMHTPAKAPLLSIAEAAELLRISRATVYRLIGAGEMPALRVGHSLRIDRDELHAWLYGNHPREDPTHATR